MSITVTQSIAHYMAVNACWKSPIRAIGQLLFRFLLIIADNGRHLCCSFPAGHDSDPGIGDAKRISIEKSGIITAKVNCEYSVGGSFIN